jgi:AbrB family looped-hinge helix DNA binding protein
MTLKTSKLSSGHQIYIPDEVLEEARIREGEELVLRVRDGVIELVPQRLAERALDSGLENLREASLEGIEEAWDSPENEAWDEA